MTKLKVVFISSIFLCTNYILAYSLAAKEVFLQHNDLTLNAHLNVVENKNLEDGVIMLVHGTLAHNGMETIKNLSNVLNERGFNTLAITLSLGINNRKGMYDCSVTHRHKNLDSLDEILAWFKWLGESRVEDVILMGHSRGGNQVTRFAIDHREAKLKKLVLLAPSTWSQNSIEANFLRRNNQSLKKTLKKAYDLIEKAEEKKIIASAGLLSCPNADATAESFISYYQPDSRHDTPSILKKLNIPTLVIAGGRDMVVKDLIGRVNQITDNDKLKLDIVDDADHFFLDLFAEDVADSIERFVAKK